MSDGADHDERKRQLERERQAFRASPSYDPSPAKFREQHPEDQFTGSSGVLFEQAMAQTRMAICLCDPHLEDMPIVFANRAFRELTGYPEDEIIGRNCRFLQGPETDRSQVAKLRNAIREEDVTVVELLNYRRDGSTFWNALHVGPIYNERGQLLYFFGSQWDVSDVRAARAEELYARDMARELSHRMKNMFSVISGIVNITGRMRGVESEAQEINERVQALGRAYETTLDEASSGTIEVGQSIRAVLEPYDLGPWKLNFRGDPLKVPYGVVSGLGLTLHELAANATNYGAWSSEDGEVCVDWAEKTRDGRRVLEVVWAEMGGPAVSEPPSEKGSGNAIIDRMVRYGGGNIEREWLEQGLRVCATYPLENGSFS
ncbi:PAS domain-containing protein [Aurantiacibacter spongiae]|uniref:histidine kinase n=1 Tax=Aurantiacibacter spongiae TaxID=2488860 RepID=A0A3N5DL74_9SPHN|nr:PAS domain-containing protein [Aurantiacibacter spongiae]RPF72442.1 PAS domain-containing protein [Aurantiacibacter spongiae]